MAQSTDSSLLESATPDIEPSAHVLLTQEQLEAHAASLAAAHAVSTVPGRAMRQLLPRLDESAERLEEAYQFLSSVARGDPQPVASEDWLRDNYHVVQDQIREVRQDLPRKFYLELPKLADGPNQGYPRVYLIARELIAHTAGRLDLETLVDFTAAYQRVAPLSIGETWAIPIMLRLALVEELRRLVDGVVAGAPQPRAGAQVGSALAAGGVRSDAEISIACCAHEVRRQRPAVGGVRRRAAAVAARPAVRRRRRPGWRCSARSRRRATRPKSCCASSISARRPTSSAIGNVITSMRLLSSIDWPLFFDRVSVVEQILRDDPAGAYAEMDFPTRDRYRHSVEQLAQAIEAAGARGGAAARSRSPARRSERDPRQRPAPSRRLLPDLARPVQARERAALSAAAPRERLARFVFKHPALGYLGTIAADDGARRRQPARLRAAGRARRPRRCGWSALIALIPVSELAISLLNALLTSQIRPRQLPKLALRSGIPADDRTHRRRAGDHRFGGARRVAAARPRGAVPRQPRSAPALRAAQRLPRRRRRRPSPATRRWCSARCAAVDELNERHGADRFFLFHRERRWNAERAALDGMGAQARQARRVQSAAARRDRHELRRRARRPVDPAVDQVRDHARLRHPAADGSRRAAWSAPCRTRSTGRGSMRELQRVTEGLRRPAAARAGQRREREPDAVRPGLRRTRRPRSVHDRGVRRLSGPVSRRQLRRQGHLRRRRVRGRARRAACPRTRCSATTSSRGSTRAPACAPTSSWSTTIPSNYLAFAARQHRWVRGDWQIVALAVAHGARRERPPSCRTRCRRSRAGRFSTTCAAACSPPALVALFVAGWTVLPGSRAAVVGARRCWCSPFPPTCRSGARSRSRVRGVPLREHVLAERDNLATSARQAFLSTVFLLHQSGVMLDAIGRTLVPPAGHAPAPARVGDRRPLRRTSRRRPSDVSRQMRGTPIAAGADRASLVAIVAPGRLPLALPILVLWCLSPALAYATGRPLARNARPLSRAERDGVPPVARRDLALLRRSRRRRRSLADPRQHPGEPPRADRAPHLADQHRPAAALDAGRLRLRLPHARRPAHPARADLRHAAAHAALPRPLLQLVRHAHARAAGAGLHLDRRQRQPRRLPGHAARRPARARRARAVDRPVVPEGLDDLVDLVEEEARRAVDDAGGGAGAEPALRSELGAAARAARRAARRRSTEWKALLPQTAGSAVGARRAAARDRGAAAGAALSQERSIARWRSRLLARSRGRRSSSGRTDPRAPGRRWTVNRAPRRRRRAGRRAQPGGADRRGATRARRRHDSRAARGGRAMRCGIAAESGRTRRAARRARRRPGRGNRVRLPLRRRSASCSRSASTSSDGRLDASYYDTLASEARLASFLAIATGKISHGPLVQARAIADAERAARARCCRGARRCSST